MAFCKVVVPFGAESTDLAPFPVSVASPFVPRSFLKQGMGIGGICAALLRKHVAVGSRQSVNDVQHLTSNPPAAGVHAAIRKASSNEDQYVPQVRLHAG